MRWSFEKSGHPIYVEDADLQLAATEAIHTILKLLPPQAGTREIVTNVLERASDMTDGMLIRFDSHTMLEEHEK